MNWQEIAVRIKREAQEAVTEILIGCGSAGVMIDDPAVIQEKIEEDIWDAYYFPEELLKREYVKVIAYFPIDEQLPVRIENVRIKLQELNTYFIPDSVLGLDSNEVKEEDWANSWKAYYKPVQVGEKIVIKPTWEEYETKPNDVVIELDPGMAFGTGTHPTTVMCIRMLEKLISGGETVFDIGTGSGILSITAAKLGAGQVTAVDLDNVAVQSARANVELNKVSDKVTVLHGNLLDNVSGQADIVVANIVADVIKLVCPDAAETVKKNGYFVSSGIISSRADEVKEVIAKAGFKIVRAVTEGEWVAVLAVREG